MRKFNNLDSQSIEITIEFIENLRKRGYKPLSLLFKIYYNRDKIEFFKTTDWDKTKSDLNKILRYPQLQGRLLLVINRLDLQIENLNKYNARLLVEFIGDLEFTVRINEFKNLNNFKQNIIDREVERYKQFALDSVDIYKSNLQNFDFVTGNNNQTDQDNIYYVDNEPEYMEDQLLYTKKQEE